MPFFESLGFKMLPRKGTADFLQEITSKKDQRQYWGNASKPYRFISPAEMAHAFQQSPVGRAAAAETAAPPPRTKEGLLCTLFLLWLPAVAILGHLLQMESACMRLLWQRKADCQMMSCGCGRLGCAGAQAACSVSMEEHEGVHATRTHPHGPTQICVLLQAGPGAPRLCPSSTCELSTTISLGLYSVRPQICQASRLTGVRLTMLHIV